MTRECRENGVTRKRDIVAVEKSKPVGTAGAVVDGPVLPVQAGPVDYERLFVNEDEVKRESVSESVSTGHENAPSGGPDGGVVPSSGARI